MPKRKSRKIGVARRRHVHRRASRSVIARLASNVKRRRRAARRYRAPLRYAAVVRTRREMGEQERALETQYLAAKRDYKSLGAALWAARSKRRAK